MLPLLSNSRIDGLFMALLTPAFKTRGISVSILLNRCAAYRTSEPVHPLAVRAPCFSSMDRPTISGDGHRVRPRAVQLGQVRGRGDPGHPRHGHQEEEPEQEEEEGRGRSSSSSSSRGNQGHGRGVEEEEFSTIASRSSLSLSRARLVGRLLFERGLHIGSCYRLGGDGSRAVYAGFGARRVRRVWWLEGTLAHAHTPSPFERAFCLFRD